MSLPNDAAGHMYEIRPVLTNRGVFADGRALAATTSCEMFDCDTNALKSPQQAPAGASPTMALMIL